MADTIIFAEVSLYIAVLWAIFDTGVLEVTATMRRGKPSGGCRSSRRAPPFATINHFHLDGDSIGYVIMEDVAGEGWGALRGLRKLDLDGDGSGATTLDLTALNSQCWNAFVFEFLPRLFSSRWAA